MTLLAEYAEKVAISAFLAVAVAPTVVRVLVLLVMRRFGVAFEPQGFRRGVQRHLLIALYWPGIPILGMLIFGAGSGFVLVLLLIPLLFLYERADRYISQARREGRCAPGRDHSAT